MNYENHQKLWRLIKIGEDLAEELEGGETLSERRVCMLAKKVRIMNQWATEVADDQFENS